MDRALITDTGMDRMILDRERCRRLQVYEPHPEDDLSPVTQQELDSKQEEMGGCLEPCERCGAGIRVFFNRLRAGRAGAFIYCCRCGMEIVFSPVQ